LLLRVCLLPGVEPDQLPLARARGQRPVEHLGQSDVHRDCQHSGHRADTDHQCAVPWGDIRGGAVKFHGLDGDPREHGHGARVCGGVSACAAPCETSTRGEDGMTLSVGVARTALTPPWGVELSGLGYYLERKWLRIRDH